MSNASNTFFANVCEPYVFGPFGGSFLTICFLDLVLPILGFLVLVTFGVSRLFTIRNFPTKIKSYTKYQMFVLFLSFWECILPGINIIYNGASSNPIPWFSYFQLIFQFCNWLAVSIFAEFEYRKGYYYSHNPNSKK